MLNIDWFQVMSNSAYPDKICNYCQLQLNMFYAFMLKATKAHETFTELLDEYASDEVDQDILVDIKSELDENLLNQEVIDDEGEQIEYDNKYDVMEDSPYEEYVTTNEEASSEYEAQQGIY